MDLQNNANSNKTSRESSKLSYKFQRLREKLRSAIASGELSGKLPGERQLAKRFHVNAKTLSKALTDLAAEGLLDRSIGRGTFVKGSAAAPTTGNERWLVLCDPDQVNSAVIDHLRKINENINVVSDTASLRPSFLNPVKAVIDLASSTPDEFLRDLVVRNISVVLIGREPTTYSVNAVLVDRSLGGAYLAREMMLAGHRRFLSIERRGQTALVESIRKTAQRFAPEATVDNIFSDDVIAGVQQGATAIICETRKIAIQIRSTLERHQIAIPARVSLAAIGSGWGDYPCSGYFLHSQQKAEAAVQ
ncbi:MAG TPA: GntR family transcriptional regulator, partial [Tepidisphaeraceae bacterium]|nr:GntR family transcriptional regulator [Tepidisphaeraceae bacterium]